MEIQLPAITQRIQIDQSGLAGSVGAAGGSFKRLGGMMGTALVAGAGAAAIAVGAFAAKGVADAATVEKGLREVNAMFGRTGPEAEASFEKLRSGVADLSNEIGIAQSTLTDGLYQAISAGVPEDNVFEFMRVAGKASIAGVTDVETAVDGITTTINAFGLEVADAEAVADSMYATVQGGKTTFGDLASSLANIAPAAAASKVSFQEVNAAIATMTSSGVGTAEATTKLRAALDGLQKPSKELDTIFQGLGHKNAQAAIEAEGMGFALDAVRDAAGGSNGKLQQLLGSSEAVMAANILAGTGAKKFADELDRQKGAAGAASGAFDEMQKSASVSWDKLKVQVQNVGISIGAALLPTLTKIVGWLSDNLPPAIEAIKAGFNAIKPVLQPVIDAVKGLFSSFGQGGGAAEGAMAKISGAVGNVRPIIESLATIFRGVFDVIRELWELIGDDIVSFISGTIRMVVGIIKGLLRAIGGIVDLVAGILTGDWARAWKGAKNLVGGIVNAIGALLRGLWDRFKAILGAIFSVVGRVFGNIWRSAVDAVKGMVRGIVDWFRELPGRAWAALSNLGSKLGSVISSAWRVAKGAVRLGIAMVMDYMRELPAKIRGVLSGAGQWLFDAGKNIVQGLINGIKNMVGAVGDAISGVAQKVRDFLPFSPAKEGPLAGSGSPQIAGAKIGAMVADGILGSRGRVAAAMGQLAAGMGPLTSGALDVRAGAALGAPGPSRTFAPTWAPSYTIQAHDVAETARAVREENGWTMALAGREVA